MRAIAREQWVHQLAKCGYSRMAQRLLAGVYVHPFHFSGHYPRWRAALGGQRLRAHGLEDQEHPQHRCGYPAHYLAAAGLRFA